jgi:hypothetical protein
MHIQAPAFVELARSSTHEDEYDISATELPVLSDRNITIFSTSGM